MSEENEDKKSRDSKPRDVLFVCVHAQDGELIAERVRISTAADSQESESENEILISPKPEHVSTVDTKSGKKERITATDEELRKLAVEAFCDKYEDAELADEHIQGPFYDRKGIGIPQRTDKGPKRRRTSIQVDYDKVRFDATKARAEFNGWHVSAQIVKNPEESVVGYNKESGRAVMILFKKEISPEPGKKKITPNSRFVWERDLKNVEMIEAAS